MTQMAGLVLCGGESRRMGRDKALLVLDGETLVLRVARTLAEVADQVLLAPGTVGRLGVTGYPEVADDPVGAGPLAGMAAGLAASPRSLSPRPDGAAVAVCSARERASTTDSNVVDSCEARHERSRRRPPTSPARAAVARRARVPRNARSTGHD